MSSRSFSVAREFSLTPGPRSSKEGPYSGEKLLETLVPLFQEAIESDSELEIDLDGTAGYATSFLEAVFGGLVRQFGRVQVTERLKLVSKDEPYLIDEILGYVKDAGEHAR